MLNHGTMCYHSDLQQAKFIAECAGLKLYSAPFDFDSEKEWGVRVMDTPGKHFLWQDRQTGGGGCRIVWQQGIAWVSSHSGYAWADITQDVCKLFEEIGCKWVEDGNIAYSNPLIYGYKKLEAALR